jgi:hypothetical protein
VSQAAAEALYGVVLNADGTVNAAATTQRRSVQAH